jgi:hypothetical protein
MTRTVIAAPLYNHERHVETALRSLLAQSDADVALVLVDDGSTDRTRERARELAAEDDRVTLHVNDRRLGMLHNTRRAWHLSRALHPEAEFWALASDHDVWDELWLARLRTALEAREDAVLAYPLTRRIGDDGAPLRDVRTWRCDTTDVAEPRRRLRAAYRCMVAGDMIYGLFRAAALERVPFYRAVLVPDRLLLSELALLGTFVQVPEILWSRRYAGLADLDRQRRAFWPDGTPPSAARLPWWVVHAGVIAREGRAAVAADLLAEAARLRARRRVQHLRRRAGRALEPAARWGLRRSARFRGAVAARTVPVPEDTRDVLQRLLEDVGTADAGTAVR